PQSFGQFETGGFETIRKWDYVGNAERIATEAVQLLDAAEMEERETALILESSQLALQIHESVGHAIELDRILGWEAAFAGTSHLRLEELGRHRYGSELMNITADATLPGALGTFGYDDEGTPAQRVPIVEEGIWVGVLSGRDTAALVGLPPGGMVRADGYNRIPMVRMTNVGLLPGDSSLDEIIADTKDGVYMATNRSWSIDDQRLNFQFGCEIAWEVKNGKLGRMLKNPTYTGITPRFWATLDRVAGEDEWVFWGTPNCGKGQPMQVAHTGHPAAPARFSRVRVGVRA
ncbi:MAG TPA: TldD/PmbA family protein, partial [Actinobacteria bacterium]|nr:TldD/PmbA family protein [Actinomycetota bacterium]